MTIVSLLGAAIGWSPAGNLKGALGFALATALLWKLSRIIRTPFFQKASLQKSLRSSALASSFGLPAWCEGLVWVAVGAAIIATFASTVRYLWPVDPRILKIGSVLVPVGFVICGRLMLNFLRNGTRRYFNDIPQIWSEEDGLIFGGVKIPWADVSNVRYKKNIPLIQSDYIQVEAKDRYGLKTAAIETDALVENPHWITADIRCEAIRRGAQLDS